MSFEAAEVMALAMRAYQQLPEDGVARALQEILKQNSGSVTEGQVIFPETPGRTIDDWTLKPMARVVSRSLNQIFSGQSGCQALAVLSVVQESVILGERQSEEGRSQYGVDCHGPFRCLYPKHIPFRRRRPPALTRASFAEVCFYAEDPKEVYRTIFRLLHAAAVHVVGKHGK